MKEGARESSGRLVVRDFDFQHEEGDRDCEHGVAEGLDTERFEFI